MEFSQRHLGEEWFLGAVVFLFSFFNCDQLHVGVVPFVFYPMVTSHWQGCLDIQHSAWWETILTWLRAVHLLPLCLSVHEHNIPKPQTMKKVKLPGLSKPGLEHDSVFHQVTSVCTKKLCENNVEWPSIETVSAFVMWEWKRCCTRSKTYLAGKPSGQFITCSTSAHVLHPFLFPLCRDFEGTLLRIHSLVTSIDSLYTFALMVVCP